MATKQHQATGSAHEHHNTTTRTTARASKTLTPHHPPPTATPTKETSGKVPPFAPLSCPQRRDPIGRPKLASVNPSCRQARDELGPAVRRETSQVLLPGARRAMDRSWERANPPMKVRPNDGERNRRSSRALIDKPLPKKSSRRRETTQTTAMSHHHVVADHIHVGTPRAALSQRHHPRRQRPLHARLAEAHTAASTTTSTNDTSPTYL